MSTGQDPAERDACVGASEHTRACWGNRAGTGLTLGAPSGTMSLGASSRMGDRHGLGKEGDTFIALDKRALASSLQLSSPGVRGRRPGSSPDPGDSGAFRCQ